LLQQISDLRMHASVALAPCVLPRFSAPPNRLTDQELSQFTSRSQPGSGLSSKMLYHFQSGSGRVVSAAGFKTSIPLLQGFRGSWCDLSAHGLASATSKTVSRQFSHSSLPCGTEWVSGLSSLAHFPRYTVLEKRLFCVLQQKSLRAAGTVTPSPGKSTSQTLILPKIFKAEICFTRDLCIVFCRKVKLRMEKVGFDAFGFRTQVLGLVSLSLNFFRTIFLTEESPCRKLLRVF
jgi:hypothetical protein